MTDQVFKKFKPFNWDDLNGKTLKISAIRSSTKSEDGTSEEVNLLVTGLDKEEGIIYVLHENRHFVALPKERKLSHWKNYEEDMRNANE